MENNLGNKKILAENLKMLMAEHGYTSKDIADLIGVKPSSVSYWINATYYPRIDKIEMLANLFHVNKSALVEDQKFNFTIKRRADTAKEEKHLLEAWSCASYDEKMQIYYVLKKYGMPEPVSEDTTAISAS